MVEFYHFQKTLILSFGRTKLHKKGSRNISFLLKKVIAIFMLIF